MAFQGLEDFTDAADEAGEVRRIEGEDLDLDVGCLTEFLAERQGALLLFDGLTGYPPGDSMCSNPMRKPRPFASAIGLPLDAHSDDMRSAVRYGPE
jgi:3-polyprenyl-4-hydroxybenzoate decarboxylase